MIPIHQCEDNSDAIPLFPVKGLFFKPISRIHVSVHYPQLKQSLPSGGKTVSSWEIMEKLKNLVAPEKFISIRVVKNTLEFIRFEGDLENRNVMKTIMSRLEGKTMKITGFKEPMKVRVAEAKIPFPSKYDWDSFFRDAKNMNEMKAGERPDTIHLQNLPCKWFSDRPSDDKPIPSEKLFRRIWDTFGDVKAIDIPMADPYRTQMQSSIAGIKTFTFSSDAVFEAYVQYRDYMSFVKAMDALRGCYILHQENSKYYVANVKVDFDKSKHLSEESIRKRRIERERLMEKEKQEKITETLSKLEEKEKSRREFEERKKETDKTQAKLDFKIAMEERKYVIARRKLEAIRLMDYLFERLKKKLNDSKKSKNKNVDLHEKIMGKYKQLQLARVEEQHKKLKKFRKSKKRRTSHQHVSEDEDFDEDLDIPSRSPSRERDHSNDDRSRDRYTRSRSTSRSPRHRSRSRSRGNSRSRSRSGSRYRSRSRSRGGSRSRSRSRSREHDRSRSRSRSDDRSRKKSSRSRSRGRSRSGDRGRSRSRSHEHEDHRRDHDRDRYHGRSDSHHRRDPDFRHRDYEEVDGRNKEYNRHHEPYYGYPDQRGFHHHRGSRGHYRGDGAQRPFRGRGRGHFPSRYIGDWELRDNHRHGPPPHPPPHFQPGYGHHGPPPPFPPHEFRGRGRSSFRGRGRGFQPYHHNNDQNRDREQYGNGPVVHRDYGYLEELDRAYEKYFKSITSKNEHEEDGPVDQD